MVKVDRRNKGNKVAKKKITSLETAIRRNDQKIEQLRAEISIRKNKRDWMLYSLEEQKNKIKLSCVS